MTTPELERFHEWATKAGFDATMDAHGRYMHGRTVAAMAGYVARIQHEKYAEGSQSVEITPRLEGCPAPRLRVSLWEVPLWKHEGNLLVESEMIQRATIYETDVKVLRVRVAVAQNESIRLRKEIARLRGFAESVSRVMNCADADLSEIDDALATLEMPN